VAAAADSERSARHLKLEAHEIRPDL
jgi:hypothetical protein